MLRGLFNWGLAPTTPFKNGAAGKPLPRRGGGTPPGCIGPKRATPLFPQGLHFSDWFAGRCWPVAGWLKQVHLAPFLGTHVGLFLGFLFWGRTHGPLLRAPLAWDRKIIRAEGQAHEMPYARHRASDELPEVFLRGPKKSSENWDVSTLEENGTAPRLGFRVCLLVSLLPSRDFGPSPRDEMHVRVPVFAFPLASASFHLHFAFWFLGRTDLRIKKHNRISTQARFAAASLPAWLQRTPQRPGYVCACVNGPQSIDSN